MQSRKLAIVIFLSALGGVTSVLVGYAGRMMTIIPIGPFASGQLLAGLHVFWLVLVAAITKSRGAATMAGAVKGSVEMLMPNHLGPFVFFISFLEGLVVDVALLPFKKTSSLLVYLASGFSSASNVLILQTFILTSLPTSVYATMYLASFISGLLFGGYLSIKALHNMRHILSNLESNEN